MKWETQTVWMADSGDMLLRGNVARGSWTVIPGTCNSAMLAELAKAIIQALEGTPEGEELFRFSLGCSTQQEEKEGAP